MRKTELFRITEELRRKLTEREERVGSELSPVFNSVLFRPSEIFDFSDTSNELVLRHFKEVLQEKGADLFEDIPAIWYEMMIKLLSQDGKEYLTLTYVDKHFPQEKDGHSTLSYLHEIGRMMWFKDSTLLSDYVFHRVEVLTSLIKVIYDHSKSKTCEQRLKDFEPYTFKDKLILRRKFEEMIANFLKTGMIEVALLNYILKKESLLQFDIAVKILKTFHLICGPIGGTSEGKYVIPYFSKRHVVIPHGFACRIPLKVRVSLRGFPVRGRCSNGDF